MGRFNVRVEVVQAGQLGAIELVVVIGDGGVHHFWWLNDVAQVERWLLYLAPVISESTSVSTTISRLVDQVHHGRG